MAEQGANSLAVRSSAITTPVEDQLYKPLKSWETRLIRLLPANNMDAPLRCELHHAALVIEPGVGVAIQRDPVQYTALSYSWGRPELSAPIVCNDFQIGIPPPVASALREIRYKDQPRWLWCDAVCIHQRDLEEKAAQVKQMLLIFSKAERVVAWLGDAVPGMDALVAIVKAHQEISDTNTTADDAALLASATKVAKALLQRQW